MKCGHWAGVFSAIMICAVVEAISDHMFGVIWPQGWRALPAKLVWLACGAVLAALK